MCTYQPTAASRRCPGQAQFLGKAQLPSHVGRRRGQGRLPDGRSELWYNSEMPLRGSIDIDIIDIGIGIDIDVDMDVDSDMALSFTSEPFKRRELGALERRLGFPLG